MCATEKEILNTNEAKELLGIKSNTTMRKYEDMGKIPFHQPVFKKFYKRSELLNCPIFQG